MMNSIKTSFAFASALLLVSASLVCASTWSERTRITFNEPVEIPGMVLPAGTYTFSLLPGPTDRHIVQIYDRDDQKFITNVLAIPDYRVHAKGHSVIKFEKSAPGSPEAVKAWFYPGLNYDEEFVYPKTMAIELAKANNESVAYTDSDMNGYYKSELKTGNEPNANAMRNMNVQHVGANGQTANEPNSSRQQ